MKSKTVGSSSDIVEKGSFSKAPAWIVFYDSMVILLLTFFVTIATKTMHDDKIKAQTEAQENTEPYSIQPNEGIKNLFIPLITDDDIGRITKTFGERSSRDIIQLIQTLKNTFYEKMSGNRPSMALYFDLGKHSVAMSMEDVVLFDEGKAELTHRAKTHLGKIAKLIAQTKYMVLIQAFTDSSPISNDNFSSNWELSSNRSVNIMQYFISEEGLPESRFVAEGLGEYSKAVNEKGRTLKANSMRRVEIVFQDVILPH